MLYNQHKTKSNHVNKEKEIKTFVQTPSFQSVLASLKRRKTSTLKSKRLNRYVLTTPKTKSTKLACASSEVKVRQLKSAIKKDSSRSVSKFVKFKLRYTKENSQEPSSQPNNSNNQANQVATRLFTEEEGEKVQTEEAVQQIETLNQPSRPIEIIPEEAFNQERILNFLSEISQEKEQTDTDTTLYLDANATMVKEDDLSRSMEKFDDAHEKTAQNESLLTDNNETLYLDADSTILKESFSKLNEENQSNNRETSMDTSVAFNNTEYMTLDNISNADLDATCTEDINDNKIESQTNVESCLEQSNKENTECSTGSFTQAEIVKLMEIVSQVENKMNLEKEKKVECEPIEKKSNNSSLNIDENENSCKSVEIEKGENDISEPKTTIETIEQHSFESSEPKTNDVEMNVEKSINVSINQSKNDSLISLDFNCPSVKSRESLSESVKDESIQNENGLMSNDGKEAGVVLQKEEISEHFTEKNEINTENIIRASENVKDEAFSKSLLDNMLTQDLDSDLTSHNISKNCEYLCDADNNDELESLEPETWIKSEKNLKSEL